MRLPCFQKVFQLILQAAPALLILVVAITIAWQNIIPGTHYAGWDNILAELDLGRYARQVFFGAWVEHQSLGAPAAQGQLSEIPRLPILFLIDLLFDTNLVRYVYIFGTYVIGGLSMYTYLRWYWFSQYTPKNLSPLLASWLAGLGGILYLLHVLTLQQFYISFEMFMAQFAFLPVVLITIHKLFPVKPVPTKTERIKQQIKSLLGRINFLHKVTEQSTKPSTQLNIFRYLLLFVGVQFLIAPSAHTPTIFYLAVLFTQLYGFMMHLPKGAIQATKVAFFIGLLTFVANAYWIVPNLYYSAFNSHYVAESRNNRIFGPESVWSIKEASTWNNFLQGTHYLFSWKDYSFANKKFDFIFNEWLEHLQQPTVIWLLRLIGILTITGAVLLAAQKQTHSRKWAILLTYLGCTLFIWVDLFPTKYFFDLLYKSESFLEAFRNPFTKLSIIYSFVSVVVFTEFFRFLFNAAPSSLTKKKNIFSVSAVGVILLTIAAIAYTAYPSFQGHFISEKLRITFPDQYQEMYAFMKTQDPTGRVLQLPQHSHAGWEYYDWQFMYPGNGYQGMGFYFFGFPQAFLNRDSDRWVETSDFFYHELKYALDTRNSDQFTKILNKYSVDYIIIDETKIDPHFNIGYQVEHDLVQESGLELIWQKDFLSIYKHTNPLNQAGLLIPEQMTLVHADTDRVRIDPVYQNLGDYFVDTDQNNIVIYPLAELNNPQPKNIRFEDSQTVVSASVAEQTYQTIIPPIVDKTYFTSTAIVFNDEALTIQFPQVTVKTDSHTHVLTQLPNLYFSAEQLLENSGIDISKESRLIVFFNDIGIIATHEQLVLPTLEFEIGAPLTIAVAAVDTLPTPDATGRVSAAALNLVSLTTIEPKWQEITQQISFETTTSTIQTSVLFPALTIDLAQNPSINCSTPKQGTIERIELNDSKLGKSGYRYIANNYAVNCNGYSFEYVSPAGSYIMRVAGQNRQGRGTKLFLNYLYPITMPEDYLLRDAMFDMPISIHQISRDVQSSFHLNWETRSFGKTSINDIETIELRAVPLERIAGIFLVPITTHNLTQLNALSVTKHSKLLDSVHILKTNCSQKNCWFGLNQSYDKGWMAWTYEPNNFIGTLDKLPHFRLNNWANGWQISAHNKQILVVYLPEIVQLFLQAVIAVSTVMIMTFLLYKLQKCKPKSWNHLRSQNHR
jgi:hypothetical protein